MKSKRAMIAMGCKGAGYFIQYGMDAALRVLPYGLLGMWMPYFAYLEANARGIAAEQDFGHQAYLALTHAGWIGLAISILVVGYVALPSGWRAVAALAAARAASVANREAVVDPATCGRSRAGVG